MSLISRNLAVFACLSILTACGGGGGGGTTPNPVTNLAPVVNAGADATIRLPVDTVSLDATVTDDGLPSNALSTAWIVQSGPTGATFADANAIDTDVTFISEGTYVLQLTADDTALQTSDTVTVVVESAPALATITVTPSAVTLLAGEMQLFSAAGLDQYGDAFAVNTTWSTSDADGTIDQAGNYTAGNVAGAFTVTAADGAISGNADVTISDSQPVANAGGPYTGGEGSPVPLDGSGSTDPNNDIVSYEWDLDNDGLFDDATGVNPTFGAANDGVYPISLRVTDAAANSDTDATTVTLNNLAPTADDQAVATDEDTPLPITLTGSDPGMDALTFAIATQPAAGTLTGTPPNVVYTPDADDNGSDSFTFTVNDGALISPAATVSITINAVNDAPTADDQAVVTGQDTALPITLTGSDPEMDPLTFAIGTGPTDGALTGTPPDVTYTPDPGFNGADSFTFTVDDGLLPSPEATVSITVSDDVAPDAPTGLSASGNDGQVSLDWANNIEADLAGYRVYRSTTQGGPYTDISGLIVVSSFDDNTVVNGTTYYYVITAEDNAANESANSAEVAVTPNGAVQALWLFDEGTGTLAADSAAIPEASDGTVSGAAWTTGVAGSALDFNGTSDHVVVDNTQALHITGTEISLTAWINPDSASITGGSRIISKRTDAGGQDVYAMILDNYRMTFRLDGVDMVSSGIMRLDEWQHVAMVYDGVDTRIYVNGVLDTAPPQAKTDPIDASSRAVHIAKREGEDRFFDGEIDEAQIFNRALTAGEVTAMHAAATPPANPVGLYFTDITASAGTAGPSDGGHGVMFADVDLNTLADLYLTNNFENTTARRDYYFENNGGGLFTESAAAQGIDDLDGGSHGGVWADLDNDGDYDLFNGTTWDAANPMFGFPDHDNVFENDGTGTFTDVTDPDIVAVEIETRGVTAFDWDNDGDLDLFGVPGTQLPLGTEAFENNLIGGTAFDFSVYADVGLNTVIAMQGVIDTDYDGDGDIDLISANRSAPPNDEIAILNNDGTGVFSIIDPATLGITDDADDGITTADIDNDGDLDMLLVSDGNGDLYLRGAGGTYSKIQVFSDVEGYMGGFADLDNDGDLDLVFAGDERVFINDGSGAFTSGQSIPVPEIDDPRGIAFADIDSDGDLDFAIAAKRSDNWMVQNDYDAGNSWIRVELVSPQCQVGAFGAKTRIYPGGLADPVNNTGLLGLRESRGNQGYLGQDEPVLHFGVGANATVDIVVDFLDGTRVTLVSQAVDGTILVDECPP